VRPQADAVVALSVFTVDRRSFCASVLPVNPWSLALYGPGGLLSALESGEAQFVLGTEEAPDVLTIRGDGVAARHALVRVAAGRIQVEDLAGGTLVNGHPITGRVEAEYPASVQVGEVTLVVEQKSEDPSQAALRMAWPCINFCKKRTLDVRFSWYCGA